jgi:hypothetical protein
LIHELVAFAGAESGSEASRTANLSLFAVLIPPFGFRLLQGLPDSWVVSAPRIQQMPLGCRRQAMMTFVEK